MLCRPAPCESCFNCCHGGLARHRSNTVLPHRNLGLAHIHTNTPERASTRTLAHLHTQTCQERFNMLATSDAFQRFSLSELQQASTWPVHQSHAVVTNSNRGSFRWLVQKVVVSLLAHAQESAFCPHKATAFAHTEPQSCAHTGRSQALSPTYRDVA